ncbi:ER lumen protein retaining receptor [Striga asiatica]|uniref:ER lumen protein-retaining receptor n=1 Tax=Striga asiatica TaxID=4170 RepID=A0A5A7QN55_STRAF|nr:ER lumen protein retaining receptor [Striga asiatica]
MNVFRLAGDMTHLLSVIVLLLKIRTMKSCAGISLKTQELYTIVFLARYLDLFTRYYSFYNTVMKLVFIGTSVCIVWYMRYHKVVKQTYNKDQDTFRHYFLIPPCLLLALLVHRSFTVMEVLWTFSLYLEAVAILPQLILLQRTKNIDNLTGNYIFLLGHLFVLPPAMLSDLVVVIDVMNYLSAYRAFYLVNWVYRFFTEQHKARWIPWLSGLVQTALYADFFYYYIKSWKNNEKLKLPA